MISGELIEQYEHLRLIPQDSDVNFQRYVASTGEEIDYYPLTNKMEVYHHSEPLAYIGCIESDEEFITLMKLIQFNRTK